MSELISYMNIRRLLAGIRPGRMYDYETYTNWIDISSFKQQMKFAKDDIMVRMDPVSPVQLLMNCDDELHWKGKATMLANQLQVTIRNRAVTFSLQDDIQPAAAIRETVAMQCLMDPELYVTDATKIMLLTEIDSYYVMTQYQTNMMNSYYMVIFEQLERQPRFEGLFGMYSLIDVI